MYKHRLTYLWLLTLMASMLVSCGGGGDDSGETANSTVSGIAFAAPINDATVKIFTLSDVGIVGTTPILETTTNSSGQFSASLPSSGNYLIEISNGTFTDEATGTQMSSGTLRGVLLNYDRSTGPFNVTVSPLTELAIRNSADLKIETIRYQLQVAAILAGGIDIASTVPVNLADSPSSDATQAQLDYGAILATLSQYRADHSIASIDALLTSLSNDFADGLLNTTGADIITAFESFVQSGQNTSNFDTGSSLIKDSLDRAISVSIWPIPTFEIVDCSIANCAPPSLDGLTASSGVALYPEGCDTSIQGDCNAGDTIMDRCYGNTCLTYVDPPTTGLWYNSTCRWFFAHDNEAAKLCPTGRGLLHGNELGLIPCTSSSSGERANGSCARTARLTFVAPSTSNLEGIVFLHNGTRFIDATSRTGSRAMKDRRLVSDFTSYIDADCTQVGADAKCFRITDFHMDPAFIDIGSHTFSALTTYGYEWNFGVTIADGEHLICNIMNGQCLPKINVGADGIIKLTLSWDTSGVDLDLHAFDPCLNEIYYGTTQQTCNTSTGALDLDDLGSGNLIENIVWETTAENGIYSVEVDYYSGLSPTNFTLKMIYGTNVEIKTGTLSSGQSATYNFNFSN